MIGEKLGNYKIIRLLGSGGMGEVYLAEDGRLGRKLALKLLPAGFNSDRERLVRFELEARAASGLNHPSILTIYDIGEVEGHRFIATEFVDGQTLRDRINAERISIDEALDVAEQAASGLACAHDAGIVHRDIKPENLMLRSDGIVKILDFGLAKLTEQPVQNGDTSARTIEELTSAGAVMGTASYMSPEQARGMPVDARTDVFSLGVVLYEMVAGRRPFAGNTPFEVISEVLKSDPEPLNLSTPSTPGSLDAIVAKALRKDPGERYQSMREMSQDLRRQKQLTEQATVVMPAPIETHESQTLTSNPKLLLDLVKRFKTYIVVAVVSLMLAAILYWPKSGKTFESIAVLPFVNVDADPSLEYLSDGITENLINSLSQLPNLKVMSRNSVFRLKGQEVEAREVGNKLGVRAVLTGRVSQRNGGLFISLDLVDAQDNRQIWGERYTRKVADVFDLQDEIAKDVSERLRLTLTGEERKQLTKRTTENIKAFQYYMQGRSVIHRRTRQDALNAISFYEKAISEDAGYALAYAGLAEGYSVLGIRGYIPPPEGRKKAAEAGRKAVDLDPNLADAHVARGQVATLFAPFDLTLAEHEMRRAIEISPSVSLAHMYLGVLFSREGRFDESIQEYAKARELDPLSVINARGMAMAYLFNSDANHALDLLRQANELGPGFIVPPEIGVYLETRAFDEASSSLEMAKRERPDDPMVIYSTGAIYAAQQKRAEALQAIKDLEEMSGTSLSEAHWIAKVYSVLNEKEQAFSWLERGFEAGVIGDFYKDEPIWRPIRSDPRFISLVRRMGITP